MKITKGMRIIYRDDMCFNGVHTITESYGKVVGKVWRQGEWFVHINFDDRNSDYNGNYELHRVRGGFLFVVGA